VTDRSSWDLSRSLRFAEWQGAGASDFLPLGSCAAVDRQVCPILLTSTRRKPAHAPATQGIPGQPPDRFRTSARPAPAQPHPWPVAQAQTPGIAIPVFTGRSSEKRRVRERRAEFYRNRKLPPLPPGPPAFARANARDRAIACVSQGDQGEFDGRTMPKCCPNVAREYLRLRSSWLRAQVSLGYSNQDQPVTNHLNRM
jgi:hypothetical protein